jgi:hypothetical protein
MRIKVLVLIAVLALLALTAGFAVAAPDAAAAGCGWVYQHGQWLWLCR